MRAYMNIFRAGCAMHSFEDKPAEAILRRIFQKAGVCRRQELVYVVERATKDCTHKVDARKEFNNILEKFVEHGVLVVQGTDVRLARDGDE